MAIPGSDLWNADPRGAGAQEGVGLAEGAEELGRDAHEPDAEVARRGAGGSAASMRAGTPGRGCIPIVDQSGKDHGQSGG